MATEANSPTFRVLKEELGSTISAAAWNAAWVLYKPIEAQWTDEYDAIDLIPDPAERQAANRQFYGVNLPTMQRARDAFMAVPAPTLEALIRKMEVADKCCDDHFSTCLADLRRLAAGA